MINEGSGKVLRNLTKKINIATQIQNEVNAVCGYTVPSFATVKFFPAGFN